MDGPGASGARPLFVIGPIALRISRFPAVLSLALLPLSAGAEGLTPLLLEFGSPRAQLWTVLEERPQGGAGFAFTLANRLALNPDRTAWPYLSGASLSFAPVLRYDRNVNNGFKGDTILIGGLPFVVDEGSRAVGAATVGGAVTGGVSFGVAQGTTLTLSGRTEYRRAVGKEFEVVDSTAAIHLGHTAQDWSYINAGFLLNEEKRALADENTRIASFTVGKLFGKGGNRLHDLSAGFIRAEENGTWQSRVRLDWTGAFSGRGVFRLGLERGEAIGGALLPRTTITASYADILSGSPTTLSATYSEKTGGSFFGAARNDDIYRLRIDRRIGKRASVYLAYERKESTVDSFDDSGLDLGVNITGFSF